MKRWIILALCICLALSVTACSQRGNIKEESVSSQSQSISGDLSDTTADRDNIEPYDSSRLGEITEPQSSVQAQTKAIPDTEKPFSKELDEMWPWIGSLDKSIYSGYYRQPSGIILQVIDVAAFRQSPAMKEAEENGWIFTLEEVHLSANEIDALITKVQFWDRRDELQISTVGASQDKSTMSIGTTSLSAQNRAIIEEYVGIGSLEFYNPEIANEVTGTGEYRMTGLDGIIEWYIPRLFDKPFVYNVLVKGSGLIRSPGLRMFNSGNKPEWNFYLQYDSATTDEQMAEQIEKILTEVYNERYDPDLIAYTIEPVPVERVG